MTDQSFSSPQSSELFDSDSGAESPESGLISSLDKFVESEPPLLATPNLSPSETQQLVNEPQFSVEQRREWTRSILAGGLLGLLTMSLLATGIYIAVDTIRSKELSQEQRNIHRELITLLWTSQVTLVGSALGFYFGSQKDQSK